MYTKPIINAGTGHILQISIINKNITPNALAFGEFNVVDVDIVLGIYIACVYYIRLNFAKGKSKFC